MFCTKIPYSFNLKLILSINKIIIIATCIRNVCKIVLQSVGKDRI